MDLREFCHALPKIELHAHLNGSLSLTTLKKLYDVQNPGCTKGDGEWNKWKDIMVGTGETTLKEAFKIFSLAHSLTTTPEAVFIATEDVIAEFAEDNVIYLEIRSTPRSVVGKMTKREYVEAIIKAMKSCEKKRPSIIVKLLISVNREHGYQAAEENIELAIDLTKEFSKYVVGIDLSGDPTKGDAFIKLLEKSRGVNLKVAAHCAEVPNEIEVMDILKFKPDRLGHCTCIHPSLKGSEKLFKMFLDSRIPTELCLTSNVKCGTVPSYSSHHFKYLYEAGHPLCISTDDKGVFATTLSREYELVGTHFGLGREQLKNISKSSVNFAFASDEEKEKMISQVEEFDVATES